MEKNQHLKFEVTNDLEEAKEIVAELLARGERPTITIPAEYMAYVKKHGIPELAKRDKFGRGYSVIAGRLGADPYFPKQEQRYLAYVDPSVEVLPRFTGKDHVFAGTIEFPRPIRADQLTFVGAFDQESYQRMRQER